MHSLKIIAAAAFSATLAMTAHASIPDPAKRTPEATLSISVFICNADVSLKECITEAWKIATHTAQPIVALLPSSQYEGQIGVVYPGANDVDVKPYNNTPSAEIRPQF